MKNTKSGKLILLGFTLLITINLFYNLKETHTLISKTYSRKRFGFYGVCGHSGALSSPSLLGKLLFKFYDSRIKFLMPAPDKEENENDLNKFRLIIYKSTNNVYEPYSYVSVGSYSYPISPIFRDYNWFLKPDEFAFLKSKSIFSANAQRLKFHIIKAEVSEEIGLFVYKNNIIVAPMKWRTWK